VCVSAESKRDSALERACLISPWVGRRRGDLPAVDRGDDDDEQEQMLFAQVVGGWLMKCDRQLEKADPRPLRQSRGS